MTPFHHSGNFSAEKKNYKKFNDSIPLWQTSLEN